MSELLDEFLSYIIEDTSVKQSKKYPGFYKKPGFGLYGKTPEGPATHRIDKVTKKLVPISKGDVQPTKSKKSEQPPSSAPSTPKMGAGFGDKSLYAGFSKLVSGTDAKALNAFVEKYGVVFNIDKNTFYITKDSKGKSISGEQRKVFGDGKKNKEAGAFQRQLFDKLQRLNVNVQTVSIASEFAPSQITPKGSSGKFTDFATQNTDGSVTFNDVTYEKIPNGDIEGYAKNEYNKWLNSKEGKSASKQQKKETLEQLTVAAFAIEERNRMLQKLINGEDGKGPEQVAIYDTDERRTAFVNSLEAKVVKACSANTQRNVRKLFEDFKKTTDATEAKTILVGILSEIDKDGSPSFKRPGAIPDVAENLTVALEMKRGRTVVVPLKSNFKASDVVSLSGVKTKGMSPSGLLKQVRSIYVGVSVKLGAGGASSTLEKTRQSVFRDFKKTRADLEILGAKTSKAGSVFDKDPAKKAARIQEVKAVIESRMDDIVKYYGIEPKPKNVDELVKFLGNGAPECVDGKTVSRRKPPAPVGTGKDKYGEAIDVPAWKLTFAMQYSWSAIYNSNVLGQAFASYTWTPKGVVEVDGLSRQAKQVPQTLKQESAGSRGMTYQPDALVSFNKPVADGEDIRNGNPCK